MVRERAPATLSFRSHGKPARYSLAPLPAAERAASAAAFRLVNLTADPSPVCAVRLRAEGIATCSCPQHARSGKCKHADALTAAGLLPSALVALLLKRSLQLELAEAECRRLDRASPPRVAYVLKAYT